MGVLLFWDTMYILRSNSTYFSRNTIEGTIKWFLGIRQWAAERIRCGNICKFGAFVTFMISLRRIQMFLLTYFTYLMCTPKSNVFNLCMIARRRLLPVDGASRCVSVLYSYPLCPIYSKWRPKCSNLFGGYASCGSHCRLSCYILLCFYYILIRVYVNDDYKYFHQNAW